MGIVSVASRTTPAPQDSLDASRNVVATLVKPRARHSHALVTNQSPSVQPSSIYSPFSFPDSPFLTSLILTLTPAASLCNASLIAYLLYTRHCGTYRLGLWGCDPLMLPLSDLADQNPKFGIFALFTTFGALFILLFTFVRLRRYWLLAKLSDSSFSFALLLVLHFADVSLYYLASLGLSVYQESWNHSRPHFQFVVVMISAASGGMFCWGAGNVLFSNLEFPLESGERWRLVHRRFGYFMFFLGSLMWVIVGVVMTYYSADLSIKENHTRKQVALGVGELAMSGVCQVFLWSIEVETIWERREVYRERRKGMLKQKSAESEDKDKVRIDKK